MQSRTRYTGQAVPVPVPLLVTVPPTVHCYVPGRAGTAGWAGLHWSDRAVLVLVLLHVLALLRMRSTGWAGVRRCRTAAASGAADRTVLVLVLSHVLDAWRTGSTGWAGVRRCGTAAASGAADRTVLVLVLSHVLVARRTGSTGWAGVRRCRPAAASGAADRAILVLVLSHVLVAWRTGSTGWAGVRRCRAAADMRGTRGSATGYGWVITVVILFVLRLFAPKHGDDSERYCEIK